MEGAALRSALAGPGHVPTPTWPGRACALHRCAKADALEPGPDAACLPPPEPHLLHVFGIANASAHELAEGHVSPPQAHHV